MCVFKKPKRKEKGRSMKKGAKRMQMDKNERVHKEPQTFKTRTD